MDRLKARTGLVLTAIAVFIFAFALPCHAKNVALVIGNANYSIGALKNPVRDAAAVSDRLKDLGFEVTEVFDGDAFSMNRAADNFLRSVKNADFALFYFAGHGIQLFDRNFLLARDLNTLAASSPKDLGIDLTQFMTRLREAGAVRVALLIDACRDNPLTFDETIELMKRLKGRDGAAVEGPATRAARGLARVELPSANSQGRKASEALVFFSAQPGSASFDGEGQNSYFVEGIKEGLSDASLPLSQIFRKVGAYVRTVTKGEQVPQMVSDWTGDVVLQGGQAAKVSYNVYPKDETHKLTKQEEDLLAKSVSGYTRFKGDFIVRASETNDENSDLSESDQKRAKDLGSVNGFSISYDLDRDGRDETINVYFRQTNYVMVIEKDGVRVEADACFDNAQDEVKSIEVALKDINGDRRPEVWIAYDTGSNWSTFCILEFQGLPALDVQRRGNTGLFQGGTKVFRTLLRGGAGWGVTVGNDNSIKVCAGSNCHSPAAYSFDGQYFRMLYSELGSEPEILKNVPFRDEAERASILYEIYRKSAPRERVAAFRSAAGSDPKARTVTASFGSGGLELGYSCARFGADPPNETLFVRWPSATAGNSRVALEPAFAYSGNLSVAPVRIDQTSCPAESVATSDNSYQIAFEAETAERCMPLLARAKSLMLPFVYDSKGLLQLQLEQAAGRELLTGARSACLARQTAGLETGAGPQTERPAANEVRDEIVAKIAAFAQTYLRQGASGGTSDVARNYSDTVSYYGQPRTRSFVITDKAKYYSRWPVRDYKLDPATLKIAHDASHANLYTVDFEYTFRVEKGADRRAGRGASRLVVDANGPAIQIRSEDGKVLQKF